MFETAELGRTIAKKEFKKTAASLREELLGLQEDLRLSRDFQVILLFAGVDGAGKGETVGLLNAWMDPAWLVTRAYDEPTEAERELPAFWKYWRDLPPRGQIGMFLSAWYHHPVLARVNREIDDASFLRKLDHIVRFERALARDGALILKFWMHLSREAQEQRLTSLENDPLTKARVTEQDWEHWRLYDRFIDTAEQVITRTNRGIAPWTVIEGADANYRAATVTTALRDALKTRLEEAAANGQVKAVNGGVKKVGNGASKTKRAKADGKTSGKTPGKANSKPKNGAAEGPNGGYGAAKAITVLNRLDMSKSLGKHAYEKRLVELQAFLHRLHHQAKAQKLSSVLVFEGPDAGGKGGAIRRINEALDVRNYQVHGIAAPTDEEKAQHYLWRFWRRLGRAGMVTIFDRSWYGRVLVERIEGFATEDEWRRSYAEINDFENQLIESGTVLVKYWLHITEEEQLARFKLREKTAYKRWKLTEEDWRNRAKWPDYAQAVNDMVQFTSTSTAPWTLVEGNDKRYARVKVLETYCERLAEALGEAAPEP